MSQILLPQRFWTQPQYSVTIDLAGLGKGIQLLFNPALGPIDLVTRRIWNPGGNASVVVNQRGKVFSFDGVDNYYSYTGYPEITSNVGTFFIWMPRVGNPDQFGHVYFGTSSPNVCGHQVNEQSQIIIGSGSGVSSGTLTGWFNSTNRSLVLVSNGTAAGTKAFVDGKDTGFTWGSSPTAWGSGSKNFNIGRYVGGVNWDFDGSILSVGMTSVVWGATEARAFHQNPWSLFKAPSRRLWTTTAGGTTALSGQALALSQGSLGVDTSVALSGQQGSFSSGALSTAGDAIVALLGQSLSSAQGLLFPEIDVSLTGQSLSSSQGGLGVSLDAGLSGQALALSQGAIGTQGDVTVALTGAGITASQGTLSPPQTPSEGGHFAGVEVVGRKRKKRDLVDRDREDIKRLIREQIEGVQQEIVQAEVPQEVKKQAKAAIQTYQSASAVDVQAMQEELSKVRQMLHMWEQQVKQQKLQRQIEEDEELLMMFL